jgi:hypothetical protein
MIIDTKILYRVGEKKQSAISKCEVKIRNEWIGMLVTGNVYTVMLGDFPTFKLHHWRGCKLGEKLKEV